MGSLARIPLVLLQAAAAPDTIIARMITERGVLDWTNGVLQFVVLMLGVAMLGTLIWLLVTVRRGVMEVNRVLQQLASDARPLLNSATAVATDARSVVAMLRSDAERISGGVRAISDELLAAAETTTRRVDDVNAVLDVLQEELEDTAIATVAAVRGVRSGARALTRRRRRRSSDDEPDSR